MLVKEVIKDHKNLIITKDGKILGIKNNFSNVNFGKGTSKKDIENILNAEIKEIDTVNGIMEDVTGIRL